MRLRPFSWSPRTERLQSLLLPAGIVALVLGTIGGLARIGTVAAHAPMPAVAWHGPLLLFGFFGVLVAVERAVALRQNWSIASPMLGVAGTCLLLANAPLVVVASTWSLAAIIAGFAAAALNRRRPSLANRCMIASCGAWFAGVAAWGFGLPLASLLPWWVAYLVLMIVGERVQFGKIDHLDHTEPAMRVLVATLLAGCTAALAWPKLGALLGGCAMLVLGAWLLVVDVTRRMRRPGLLWFVSVGLACSYAWLALSGAIWIAVATGLHGAALDASIHAVFQGFVLGMVFTHAPMIFPAVIGLRMPFHRVFHVHMALLQVGLAMRVAGDISGRMQIAHAGSRLTAVATLLFVGVSITSIAVGRSRGRDVEERCERHEPRVTARA